MKTNAPLAAQYEFYASHLAYSFHHVKIKKHMAQPHQQTKEMSVMKFLQFKECSRSRLPVGQTITLLNLQKYLLDSN